MNSRIALALVAMLAPAALSAQSNQDLQKQIEQLKVQLKAVEEKAATPAGSRYAPDQGRDQGRRRQHPVGRRPPHPLRQQPSGTSSPTTQFMGFAQNTPSASAIRIPSHPLRQPVPAQDWTNSVQWSTRLRLNMGITINEHAKIMGRLTMYKVHGGADVPTFNGSPNTVSNSFNSGQGARHGCRCSVERASLVYDFIPSPASCPSAARTPPMARHSKSAKAASARPPPGPGRERHGRRHRLEVPARQDRPPEGTLLGFCYGVGYECGFGGGGSVKSSAAPSWASTSPTSTGRPTRHGRATPAGGQHRPPEGQHRAGRHVRHAPALPDRRARPERQLLPRLQPVGQHDRHPLRQPHQLPRARHARLGGMPSTQYVTATDNLGDMDQWTATWKHKIGDTFTYFASGGYIKSHPNGKVSQYGAYWTMPAAMGGHTVQLAGFGGLLGDPNKSETATAYYAGLRWDPTPKSASAWSSTTAPRAGGPTAPPPARPPRSSAPAATCGRATSTGSSPRTPPSAWATSTTSTPRLQRLAHRPWPRSLARPGRTPTTWPRTRCCSTRFPGHGQERLHFHRSEVLVA